MQSQFIHYRYFIALIYNGIHFALLGEGIGQPNKSEADDLSKPTSPLSQFWIAGKLNAVDWYQLMSNEMPHLRMDQKESVLNIAGRRNINPLFIITYMILEHQPSLDNPSPDSSKLLDSARKMADLLHEQFLQAGDAKEKHINPPNDELSKFRNVFGGEEEKLKAYVELYGQLFTRHIENFQSPLTAVEDREEFSLTWPWPVKEQWTVGGTHGHNQIWSGLDMNAFGGTCRWDNAACKDNGDCCVEATPNLLAMSSGTVSSVISKCQIRINHSSGWGISYYHMDDLKFKPGDYVQKGQVIGKYAGDYPTAICEGGKSAGPHLHMDLHSNGQAHSLDGKVINGYKVHAGQKDYDTDCSRCWFEKGCMKYCPYHNPITHDVESGPGKHI